MINFNRVKEIRKDKDLTQSDVAKYLNIKLYTYSKYEININIPSLETVYNISKLFYLNIDYVIGLSDKRNKKGLTFVIYEDGEKDILLDANIRLSRLSGKYGIFRRK